MLNEMFVIKHPQSRYIITVNTCIVSLLRDAKEVI